MHIITTARAEIAGRLYPPGTVLDLPEQEAAPALEAGTAQPWLDPAAATQPGEVGFSTVDGGQDSAPGADTAPAADGQDPLPAD